MHREAIAQIDYGEDLEFIRFPEHALMEAIIERAVRDSQGNGCHRRSAIEFLYDKSFHDWGFMWMARELRLSDKCIYKLRYSEVTLVHLLTPKRIEQPKPLLVSDSKILNQAHNRLLRRKQIVSNRKKVSRHRQVLKFLKPSYAVRREKTASPQLHLEK